MINLDDKQDREQRKEQNILVVGAQNMLDPRDVTFVCLSHFVLNFELSSESCLRL